MGKILIVDDEEMMREIVKEFIVADGLYGESDVFFACDGSDGLTKFEEVQPDIVITDMNMPRMNGAEMITKLRSTHPDTQFVVMTAYADIDNALSAMRAGAFEMLRKPFEPSEINICIRQLTEKLLLRKENLQYREKLVQAEKMSSLGLLSAGIAHEINNPNTFVKGSLELLQKFIDILKPELDKLANTPGPDQAKLQLIRDTALETVKTAIKGTDRISKIVNGLATFSRNPTGSATPAQVAKLWEEAMTLAQHRLKYHDVEMNIPADLKPIYVDVQAIVQVLMNLLVNAVDAIETKLNGKGKGKITLSANDESDEQVITITDSGTGMDQKTLDSIFVPFFSTKGLKGTGLGLSISKGAVESQKGTLEVTSVPGQSTTFTLRFPTNNSNPKQGADKP